MAPRIFPESVRKIQASKSMRLRHELWHFVRSVWGHPRFPEAGREILRELGWDLPSDRSPFSQSRHLILDNFSGEDFLFMHRDMIKMTDRALAAVGEPPIDRWQAIPEPGDSDYPVPAAWIYDDPAQSSQENQGTTDFLEFIKSDAYYENMMSVREAFFSAPGNLRRLSLGALGNLAEMTIHNAMHMRWSSEPAGYRPAINLNDPSGGDARWDKLDYDYLGDTYSSHVNPYFWHLHGWIDSLIVKWAEANEIDEIQWTGTWLGGPDLAPVLMSETDTLLLEAVADRREITGESLRNSVKKLEALAHRLPFPITLVEFVMNSER